MERSVLLMEHCSENLGWVEEHLSGFDIDLFWASSASEAISGVPGVRELLDKRYVGRNGSRRHLPVRGSQPIFTVL